jgi:hypothetical protein
MEQPHPLTIRFGLVGAAIAEHADRSDGARGGLDPGATGHTRQRDTQR